MDTSGSADIALMQFQLRTLLAEFADQLVNMMRVWSNHLQHIALLGTLPSPFNNQSEVKKRVMPMYRGYYLKEQCKQIYVLVYV